jgi:predicted nucleotidyltransferase
MMTDKMLETSIRSFFNQDDSVHSSILFGSFASDRQHDDSDVDIAVLFDPTCIPEKMKLFEMCESLSDFLSRDVDLICLNTADPIIGMQVYKSGRVITNRNNRALQNYFSRLMIDYIEIKEIRKSMEEGILKRKIDG